MSPSVQGATSLDIRVENLHHCYNPGTPPAIRALEAIDFHLPSGTVLGILGGTGSGKTTLVRHLNGLLLPSLGRVLVGGKDTRTFGSELTRTVGVVFQRPERQLFEETVYADVAFVLRRFSQLPEADIEERVRAACALLGLDIDRIGRRSPWALSDAERRKVAVACILVNEPEVLVLDEPAVGLDPRSVSELVQLMEQMKQAGDRTMVIVSHDMEEFLTVLDYLLVLDAGRQAAFGTVSKVCARFAGDPHIRPILPELAVLVHDLRAEGYPIPEGEFRIPILVDLLTRSSGPQGGLL